MTTDSENIRYWVADPSIWSRKGDSGLSGAETMKNTYRDKKRMALDLVQGNNDRVNGWSIMREYLKPFMVGDKKMAKLQVFSTCYEFIRTFPTLIYDAIKVEDCDSDGEDHAADSVRYGIMSNPTPAIVDPMWLKQKLFNQRQRKNRERNKPKKPGFYRMTGY
jgi:hypothetical protein